MAEFLRLVLSIAVVTFSMSTMFGVGLGHPLRHVLNPMRDARGVTRALIVNFVLVPLLAFGLIHALPLEAPYRTGLMLVATAAGAPFLVKLAAVARASVALAASLMMLLLLVTVVYMPLVVPWVIPGVEVSVLAISFPLVWTMVLPMALGLVIRSKRRSLALRLQPWAAQVSTAALAVLVAATVGANLRGIAAIVLGGAIVAPFLLIGGAFLLGYVFGREYRGGHVIQGLGAAQRNIAAATVVATQAFDDPRVVLMVVVISLVDLAMLFPIAWGLRKLSERQERFVHA